MTEYLLELYVSRIDAGAVSRAAERAQRAAAQQSREGVRVRYVRSIHVAEDETCFFLFEAESIEVVRAVARAALLPLEHVVEVVAEPLR